MLFLLSPLTGLKCSATLASVAAPPPGAQQGFGGPNCLRHPCQVAVLHPPLPRAKISATGGSGMGCDRGVAATPLRHTQNFTPETPQSEIAATNFLAGRNPGRNFRGVFVLHSLCRTTHQNFSQIPPNLSLHVLSRLL